MSFTENTRDSFKSPDEIFGELFTTVQLNKIFPDNKTFADCIPKTSAAEILKTYDALKNASDFNLKHFVYENFILPDLNHVQYTAHTTATITKHIHSLWDVLTRQTPKRIPDSSLIDLPYPYVVPGGRFRELFYWDSYFILLGLQETDQYDLIKKMVGNFSFLIDTFGFIPNGNRTYFLSRSQPPFYACMIDILADKDPLVYMDHLPYLEKEYMFWMRGTEHLSKETTQLDRVVRMPDGEILNRFWDPKTTPRPEAYAKEVHHGHGMNTEKAGDIHRNIRAMCESGWDFSSRWLKDATDLKSSYITDIVPVDLNCLLYHLETTISKSYTLKNDPDKAAEYYSLAVKRKTAILKYCWSEIDLFFMDYNLAENMCTPSFSLAAAFPLFFNLANPVQAKAVSQKLKKEFLQPGGFLTTLKTSSFQWDSPNGWAPLQWITVKGLLNYGENELAVTASQRWMQMNDKIYQTTGKLMEKYNVTDLSLHTGGGEYQLQDGFGWTNGVYLKLQRVI